MQQTNRMRSRAEVSAGGLVYRQAINSGYDVLICKDAGYHKWVLPKGLVNKGEDLQQAAMREVREEVGVVARVIGALGEPEKYVYISRGMRVFKTVHYFLMEYESGSESDHDHEMEDVRWVSLDAANDLLYYKGAKTVLQRARDLLKATPKS